MASPFFSGTSQGSVYTSKDISIINEDIFIKIDSNFQYFQFEVEYEVFNEFDSLQIPLVFEALDYDSEMTVYVNGVNTSSLDLSGSITKEQIFSQIEELESPRVSFDWNDTMTISGFRRGLHYFNAPLNHGLNHIKVHYTALANVDRSGWIKEYSLFYSLAPVKYWKGFEHLKITIDATGFPDQYEHNLGETTSGNQNQLATWSFHQLPADYILLQRLPLIPEPAQTFIEWDAFDFLIIAFLIGFIIHWLLFIKFYKRLNLNQIKWLNIIITLLLGIIPPYAYIYYYSFVDSLIGEHAANFHGYIFLIYFTYPVIVLVHYILLYLLIRILKLKKQ